MRGSKLDWALLGYKEYPFSVNPISINTLELFTGHSEEVKICESILNDRNIRLVIEGARGLGTTSFANFLKFSAQKKSEYLAPRDEVSVERGWNLESLLIAIISTVVREFEISHLEKVKKKKIFLDAKALCYRLSEAFNNFGVSAFSFGGSYGKSNSITQPSFIPSTTLGHHLEDLGKLAIEIGYSKGLLIQLNNLDINTVHTEDHLEHLFNAARDYFQIENISWFLVGDVGLRGFISRKVDRLDDIISDEIYLGSVTKKDYHDLIKKRLDYYKLSKSSKFPFDNDVFDYLFDLTDGRLRYVFGLIYSLTNRLHIGKLVQQVSLDLAKSTIVALAQSRLRKHNLSSLEIKIVKTLVKLEKSNVSDLAKQLGKNRTMLSRHLNKLLEHKVISVEKVGSQRIYSPRLDSKIAYS